MIVIIDIAAMAVVTIAKVAHEVSQKKLFCGTGTTLEVRRMEWPPSLPTVFMVTFLCLLSGLKGNTFFVSFKISRSQVPRGNSEHIRNGQTSVGNMHSPMVKRV
mmetsp:Transcript_17851/g.35258  ORF Transcript_17851/g.35258 Transcript_17851/m.35258 type:complete len:104 (-) Transcript_17851:238-549(-)